MRPRLPRILLNTATATSLLLCIAAAVMAVRSHHREDVVQRVAVAVTADTQSLSRLILQSRRGSLEFSTRRVEEPLKPSRRYRDKFLKGRPAAAAWTWQSGRPDFLWDEGGFDMWSRYLGFTWWLNPPDVAPPTRRESSASFDLSWWTLCAAFAPLPMLVAARRLHRHVTRPRSNDNTCQTCGYDLRATPTRCPECGHSPR